MADSEPIDYVRPLREALWVGALTRAAACPQLDARVLLHAGPPYRGAPPAPVIHAAIQAMLYEGLADGEDAALDRLRRREVELRPAQDHGIATPLAQVVSASMPLLAVRLRGRTCFAPVIEGPAPALRFGSPAPQCLSRLRAAATWLETSVTPRLQRAPIAVGALVQAAVAAGEECHALTAAANRALLAALGRDPGRHAEGRDGAASDDDAVLRANPAFVLSVLMAACAAALGGADQDIEAIGGNGVDFGIRRRGGRDWRQLPADPPRGPRLAGCETVSALPAIGDSALIDYCGLGAQALPAAPRLCAEWSEFLPPGALGEARRLIDPGSGLIDPQRIVKYAAGPLVNLAILDRDGGRGLLGRGFYAVDAALFGGGRKRAASA